MPLWGFCILNLTDFSRPNEPGQSNMSPADGAQLWKEYIDPLKDQGYTLISPAPSSRPDGFTWVGEFLGNCTGCTVDRIALHYYDITSQGFIDWVTKFHDAYGRDIWVTEFADQVRISTLCTRRR